MMYEMSLEDRKALAPYHRAFQIAVALTASQALKSEDPPREGGKWEGGIWVNRREIHIGANDVYDLRRSKAEKGSRPEEVAVVNAIRTVVDLFHRRGAQAILAFEALPEAQMGFKGDCPLNAMFNLGIERPPERSVSF